MTDAAKIEAMAQDFVCSVERLSQLQTLRQRGKWKDADEVERLALKRACVRLLVSLSLPFVPDDPKALAKAHE